jgi:hypothetical protein
MADHLGLFRRWQRDGTWQTILTALQAKRTEGLPGAIGKSGGARCCPRLMYQPAVEALSHRATKEVFDATQAFGSRPWRHI